MNHARSAGRAGLAVSLLTFVPSLAHAHTGMGVAAGFTHGFAHPLLGADHLLAMIAVGIFAAQRGGRALWALPATFVGVMIAGFLLAAGGIPLPGVELAIMASLVVLGAVVAGAVALPTLAAAVMVGAFALFHGHAHGAEMPAAVAGAMYVAGFGLATVMLHGAGIALTLAARGGVATRYRAVERLAGAGIAVAGMVLLLG